MKQKNLRIVLILVVIGVALFTANRFSPFLRADITESFSGDPREARIPLTEGSAWGEATTDPVPFLPQQTPSPSNITINPLSRPSAVNPIIPAAKRNIPVNFQPPVTPPLSPLKTFSQLLNRFAPALRSAPQQNNIVIKPLVSQSQLRSARASRFPTGAINDLSSLYLAYDTGKNDVRMAALGEQREGTREIFIPGQYLITVDTACDTPTIKKQITQAVYDREQGKQTTLSCIKNVTQDKKVFNLLHTVPNDPRFIKDEQWGLQNTFGTSKELLGYAYPSTATIPYAEAPLRTLSRYYNKTTGKHIAVIDEQLDSSAGYVFEDSWKVLPNYSITSDSIKLYWYDQNPGGTGYDRCKKRTIPLASSKCDLEVLDDLRYKSAFIYSKNEGGALKPLYACRAGTDDYFISSHEPCEGQTKIEDLGYAYPSDQKGGYLELALPTKMLVRAYDDTIKKHVVASPERLRIYKAYNHKITEERTWKLLANNSLKDQTYPLYLCLVSKNGIYGPNDPISIFVTTSASCPGNTDHLGYLYPSNANDGSRKKLYQCRIPSADDNFVSEDPNCERPPGVTDNWTVGFLGYALSDTLSDTLKVDYKNFFSEVSRAYNAKANAGLGRHIFYKKSSGLPTGYIDEKSWKLISEQSPSQKSSFILSLSLYPSGANFPCVETGCNVVQYSDNKTLGFSYDKKLDGLESLFRCFMPSINDYFVSSHKQCEWQLGNQKTYDIGAVQGWDIDTGKEIVVAVLDSGIDGTHPDLQGHVYMNQGWDFVNNDNDASDDLGHGTLVAGIIGASTNNNQGIAGINWRIKIVPIKMLDAQGNGILSQIIAGITYAVSNGYPIINASWGGNINSPELITALKAARDAGILIVASSGNNGDNIDMYPTYPASYSSPQSPEKLDNIISVASINQKGGLSNFSNYGIGSVQLGAPGEEIVSTAARKNCRLCSPDGYAYFSGTSFSAPHVTGVASILWGYIKNPTYQDIKKALLNGVQPLPSLLQKTSTGGLLNLKKSLDILTNG